MASQEKWWLIQVSDVDIDSDCAGNWVYVISGLGDGRGEWQMKKWEGEVGELMGK